MGLSSLLDEAAQIELLRGLVAIPSLSDHERPAVDYLVGKMTELGGPGACLEPFLLPQGHLVLEEDAKPFHMLESLAFGVGGQIAQAFSHAV